MNPAIGRLTAGSAQPSAEGATAFAVSDGTGLTAFHCVGDRATGQLLRPTVTVAFRSGSVCATVERWDAGLDLALLRFDDSLPPDEHAVAVSDEAGRVAFWSRGYPVASGGYEVSLSGRIVDTDARLFETQVPALQLHCDQSSAPSPLPLGGFSGAPILLDDPPRAVGVIRWNPPNPDNPRLGLGAIVYGTPIGAVLELWGEAALGTKVLRPSQRSRKQRVDGLLRLHTDDAIQLPRAGDIDPSGLGATPTKYTKTAKDVYVPRTVDRKLEEKLISDRLVLLLGPATSGKSRTGAEALTRALPDAGVLWPKSQPQSLRRLLDLDADEPLADGQLVIWLDRLDQYLSEDGGLDESTLELIQDREPPAYVLATMTLRAYEECLHGPGDRSRLMRAVVDDGPFTQVEIRRELLAAERQAAAAAYPGEDWVDEAVGIAERLTAAKDLLTRMKTGSETFPPGWLAVRAAIDWQRIEAGAIAEPTWRKLFLAWAAGRPGFRDANDDFDKALKWAEQPVASKVALVSSEDDMIRGRMYWVMDYIAENVEPDSPVADVSWEIALSSLHRLDELSSLLIGAFLEHGRKDVAERAVPLVKAAGDEFMNVMLPGRRPVDKEAAQFFVEQFTGTRGANALVKIGDAKLAAELENAADDAAYWYEEAAKLGDLQAMIKLGIVLSEAGKAEEAETWMLKAVQTGSVTAMVNLSTHYFRQGKRAQAAEWIGKAARQGNTTAMVRAAWLAREDGQDGDALRWSRRAAEAGDSDGMYVLGQLLAERGDRNDAVTWWLHAAEHEHLPSLRALLEAVGGPREQPDLGVEVGRVLQRHGHLDEAITLWEQAANAGSAKAWYQLGLLYRERQDSAAARHWLTMAAEAGLIEAATALGVVLYEDGDTSEALRWWHDASQRGDATAAHNIAHHFAATGDEAEAVPWYELAAQRGYPGSAYQLGVRCWKAQDQQGARRWWKQAADSGFVPAMLRLGALLAQAGERADAREWLIKASDGDSAEAAFRLYQRDAEDGDYGTARRWLQLAAERGFPAAESLLRSIEEYEDNDSSSIPPPGVTVPKVTRRVRVDSSGTRENSGSGRPQLRP
jgi:TPR repeat protein